MPLGERACHHRALGHAGGMGEVMLPALAAAGCGAVVGAALGLTGGGGSIFAVPLLIYALGVLPADAVAMSLVAVAAAAVVGAAQSLRYGLVVWQPTILFAAGGVLGAPVGATVGHRVDPEWLVAAFAVLAVVVGGVMWHASRAHPEQAEAVRALPRKPGRGPISVLAPSGQLRFTAPCAAVLAVAGVGTGFLAGLLGVGGGFLIVPALVLVTRMGVHRAVATSLLVITLIGAAGAATAVWQGRVDWSVLAPFAVGGGLAMIGARSVAQRVAGPALQRAFAASIIVVGVAMLAASVLEGGLPWR
jgi:uncharacterized membrane protein YfcA